MRHAVLVVSLASFFTLVGVGGCATQETAVTMEQVPAAVRATLTRESAGGKVTEVEKEVKNGKTVYSADITVGGEEWDLTVAEDGSVISKEKEGAAKQ